MRELQQITTPFNSIFTIRDLSAAVHLVQDDGDGVKGKASREMSLVRNGGRKQGGLVCRSKKHDSLAHGVSKEHDDCLPGLM